MKGIQRSVSGSISHTIIDLVAGSMVPSGFSSASGGFAAHATPSHSNRGSPPPFFLSFSFIPCFGFIPFLCIACSAHLPARTSLTVYLPLRVTNHRRSVVLFVVLFLIDGANNSRMVWGLSSSHSCDRTVIRTTRCARQLGGSRVTVSRANAFFCLHATLLYT